MESSRYQTFWPRFGAVTADLILLTLANGIVTGLVGLTNVAALQGAWSSLHYFLYDFYAIYMHGKYGQTIGKRQMGMLVQSIDESSLTWNQAIRRNVVSIGFSSAGLIWLTMATSSGPDGHIRNEKLIMAYAVCVWVAAEIFTVIANTKRRAIHDYIAGSVVVRAKGGDPD